jgi:carbonic anhydrase/acetyltransferase-like protein (isoleucine patch superfamily)
VLIANATGMEGDVKVGQGSSIWYGFVLKGDENSIAVGSGTNIQENTLVHVARTNISGKVLFTIIDNEVTIGHCAMLHGCIVEDEAFVGIGATLLDRVVLEKMLWLRLDHL